MVSMNTDKITVRVENNGGKRPYRAVVEIGGRVVGFGGACATRMAAEASGNRERDRVLNTIVAVIRAVIETCPVEGDRVIH